mgnify:CR=1 FL=1
MELNYRKNNNKQLFETISDNNFLDITNVQNYFPLYNNYFDLNINNYNTINLNPRNTNLDPRLRPGGNGQNLNVTEAEIAAVVAFMQTLGGNNVYVNKKWSNPFLN